MYTRSTELYHHGIKGMKWGVRRFQTKDGSLTPAGRKRYADDVSEKKAAYKAANKEYKKSFNKASNRAFAAYSPSKKHRRANDARWEDAANKAEKANKAQAEYKQAKKAAKENRTPEEIAARRKKAIKVGAAVAGTALAAYGAYKLNDYVKTKNCQIAAKRGSDFADSWFDSQVRSFKENNGKMFEVKSYRVDSGARSAALSRYDNASNDSFRTAAKNVRNYKKSGGNLKSLKTRSDYANMSDRWYQYEDFTKMTPEEIKKRLGR